jgi:hypothetical protein
MLLCPAAARGLVWPVVQYFLEEVVFLHGIRKSCERFPS